MKNIFIKIIRGYQSFNTWLRSVQIPGMVYSNCKFHPSCSDYALLSIERHGVWRGSWKSFVRILRCNPFSRGGVDYP